jgi:membrane associated rhomboid family serine protease
MDQIGTNINAEDQKASNRTRFWLSLLPFIAMVFIMSILFLLDENGTINYTQYGILPRKWSGLKGILFAPWIHGSLEHLGNNSIPLLVLGTTLLYYYKGLGVKAGIIMYFLSGLLVWLSAQEAYHIGASGFIYALAGFIFLSGILRRERSLIAISLLVSFLYGSMFWGIFPVKVNVSWEGHLWGGIVGFTLAWYYRKEGPQRKPFYWELEEEDTMGDSEIIDELPSATQENIPASDHEDKPSPRIIVKYTLKKTESRKKK